VTKPVHRRVGTGANAVSDPDQQWRDSEKVTVDAKHQQEVTTMPTLHGHFNFGRENPPRSTFHDRGKFGRLFPTLPPFAHDTPTIREALKDIGKVDGIMDPRDDLSDPITSITDPAKSLNNPNNPDLSAGFTFLGQFLDHDLTFDPTSSLERQQDPEAIANFRTPLLELDNVYGSGPTASPHLYDQMAEETKFYIEEIPASATKTRDGSTKFDVPRNLQNTAWSAIHVMMKI
jgi:hypothetical protein